MNIYRNTQNSAQSADGLHCKLAPTCLQESAALNVSLQLAHIKSIHNNVKWLDPIVF